jgi:RNA polymerase sigma factor (sigma-70 family)
MNKQDYFEKLTNEYLSAFFAFGMKNTNDAHEAEEFAQEAAYQCVLAINKAENIQNFNGFVWSVAHNTYKRWRARKKYASLDDEKQFTSFSKIMSVNASPDAEIIKDEEKRRIHLELSRLTGLYRKTVVCFYYDEISINETAEKLNISVEMVKFYLQKGRKKLKEAYTMPSSNIGEKSFNPSEFTVYGLVDHPIVDVWEVFKRKPPCQIAVICHDSEKTINEISLETGIPAVYIEEEIELLMDTGLIISPTRGKYRTNFFILKKNILTQIREQFNKLYEKYSPSVIAAYDKYLPKLKQTEIFKHDVPDGRYAWFFADKAASFIFTEEINNYPQILSCGTEGFVFAEEAKAPPWARGKSPTTLDECVVWPCDIVIFGGYHHQRELRSAKKCQALYDVYTGRTNDSDIEIYAQLIEEGYVIKKDGELFCNVAVSTKSAREVLSAINSELEKILAPLCKELRDGVGRIVKSTIPTRLKEFAQGYTEIWLMFYADTCFLESLYNKGFITVPESDDKTPAACYIYRN